jgi:hypothetical protein
MHRTRFAGLTAPDPDDAALQVDGGSFANRNPDITDFFLSIGAVTHRHDEHLPLASPTHAPSAVVLASGGSIESGTDLYFGWTASDSYGGETILSPPTLVSTIEPAPDPSGMLSGTFVSSAGVMPTGTYTYGITVMDAGGGEGVLGPTVTVQRDPGFASGSVLLDGLTGDLLNDGDRWRLWRSDNGGPFNLIAVGTVDEFWDYGIDPVDHAATPPLDSSRTRATSSVQVTLPMASGASGNAVLTDPHTTAFNLYLSLDGTFASPALVAVFPLASAGATITLTDTFTEPGAPPEVATSIRGANRIDPDTELIDWHWKRPVAASGSLPLGSATASGDVRVVLADGLPWRYLNGVWAPWTFDGIDVDDGTTFLHDIRKLHFASGATVLASGADGAFVIGGGGGGGASGITVHFAKVAYSDVTDIEFAPDGLNVSVDVSDGFATITHKPAGRTQSTGDWFAASGDQIVTTIPLAPGYRLITASASQPCRVRVYTDTTAQAADTARPIGTPPTGDHGVNYEHVFASGAGLFHRIAPNVMGSVLDGAPGGGTADLPITVDVMGGDGEQQVILWWQQTEAYSP